MFYVDWILYCCDDGELFGWIYLEGGGWVVVDVFGCWVFVLGEWLDVEFVLEGYGIVWFVDLWMFEGEDDCLLCVCILEVMLDEEGILGCIVVKVDDFGDMS